MALPARGRERWQGHISYGEPSTLLCERATAQDETYIRVLNPDLDNSFSDLSRRRLAVGDSARRRSASALASMILPPVRGNQCFYRLDYFMRYQPATR